MQIKHKLDSFLPLIFPELEGKIGGGNDLIIRVLERHYAFRSIKPKVLVEDGWVRVEIDTSKIIKQEAGYNKVVGFCEKGKYTEAKSILKKLIENNPSNSEFHRIMGQILSDEGDQDEAINCLIDALRWDPKNGWALLMMGNIFAKFKADVPTAMKYYDQALIANPKDFITINNIAAQLTKQGKLQEAKKYFSEALKINKNYPNTHFALGMISDQEGQYHAAFESTVRAIKYNEHKDNLYQNSVKQGFRIAQKVIETNVGEEIFTAYHHKLIIEGAKEVDILQDEEILTAAKLEFAENYNRLTHVIKYKPSRPAVAHIVMHELVHLDFVIEARKEGINQLFIATQEQKAAFIKGLGPTIKKFRKIGVAEKAIRDYCSRLFDGINSQIFNAPIDLFIEDFLFEEYEQLRPFQFISLYTLLQEGLKAVTDKQIVELSPKDINSKSKVYNLVGAMQFKELFGLDFLVDYNASPEEIKLAKSFYEEYLDYKDDKEPGEEYELVQHWAEDLKLEKNFELINEQEYRNKRTDIDSLLSSIEKDPYDLNSNEPHKQKEMEKFQKAEQEKGTNMAVVMFMVDAFQYFESMPKAEIKKTAYEIATLGTQGFSPDKDNYKISSIKGKTFTGYHILAYYYVSWSLAIPEMLSQLQLPFDKEYELAFKMYNSNKK